MQNTQPSRAPRPGSVHAKLAAHQNAQALLRLDHSIRSLAPRLGADRDQTEDLVLAARSVFTIVNAIPIARDAYGHTILAPDTGFPLTPEQWLRQRLTS